MAQVSGTRQIVLQGITDSISYRLFNRLTGGEVTLTGAPTVAIYSPAGVAITHGGTASASSSVGTLSFSVVAGTFPVGDGYKAVWTFQPAPYKRTSFFDVALRLFESQLCDTDVTNYHKGISLPTGVSSWAIWRQRAWRRIERMIRSALRASPNLVFYPEKFFDAHLALTLAEFFRPDALDERGEEWLKYREFLREGMTLVQNELADLDYDADGDGLLDTGDTGHDMRLWLDRELGL